MRTFNSIKHVIKMSIFNEQCQTIRQLKKIHFFYYFRPDKINLEILFDLLHEIGEGENIVKFRVTFSWLICSVLD